jgi:hypothetical protein
MKLLLPILALFAAGPAFADCLLLDLNEDEIVGCVDGNSLIYKGECGGKAVGHVDSKGVVHDVAEGKSPIGFVDAAGKIFGGQNESRGVGYVNRDGMIHDVPRGKRPIARALGCTSTQAGAGSYLLFWVKRVLPSSPVLTSLPPRALPFLGIRP